MAIGFWDKLHTFGTKVKTGLGKAFNFAQRAHKIGKTYLDENPTIKGLASNALYNLSAAHPNFGKSMGVLNSAVTQNGSAGELAAKGLAHAATAISKRPGSIFSNPNLTQTGYGTPPTKKLKGAETFRALQGGGHSTNSLF